MPVKSLYYHLIFYNGEEQEAGEVHSGQVYHQQSQEERGSLGPHRAVQSAHGGEAGSGESQKVEIHLGTEFPRRVPGLGPAQQ